MSRVFVSQLKKSGFSLNVDSLKYHNGFANYTVSEAIPNTVPEHQNTPQRCAHGLYAEQLSGTSFTTPRLLNQKTWMYRIRPTAAHQPFVPIKTSSSASSPSTSSSSSSSPSPVSSHVVSNFESCIATPNQLRWRPVPLNSDNEQVDFVQGLHTVCGAGKPDHKEGLAIHIYTCNTSMKDKAMCNSDGDFLIVPQQGALLIRTEMGYLYVPPSFIAVIQRGITFSVEVNERSRGYICEIYNSHFRLPELGPIGSNGLASPRDFQLPTASYEDRVGTFHVVQKFLGGFWMMERDSSPFDVVGWHGNYVPYRYDLTTYCVVNATLYDHLDPSIFTVLTAPSNEPGVAICDFVIFPPRYSVQENSFRPPYYHRNVMSEYMGNIMGQYEAKGDGFLPGGGSLHSIGAGHGPDADAFVKASNELLKPTKLPVDNLAFMFESTYMYRITEWAMQDHLVDKDYYKCWTRLPRLFQVGKYVDAKDDNSIANGRH